MEKVFRKTALIYGLALFVVLSLDLITKNLAESFLREKDISLLPFLHLVLVYNRGVAFGFLANAPDLVRIPVLFITPLIALVITFLYSTRVKGTVIPVFMGMVGGGALGNFYDRVFLGHVRDFIYLSYGGLSWPAFNLADASISTAITLLILRELLPKGGKN